MWVFLKFPGSSFHGCCLVHRRVLTISTLELSDLAESFGCASHRTLFADLLAAARTSRPTEISCCQLHFHPSGVCMGWDRATCMYSHANP